MNTILLEFYYSWVLINPFDRGYIQCHVPDHPSVHKIF